MRRLGLAVLTLSVLLSACTSPQLPSTPTDQPAATTPTASRSLGRVEVSFTGVGTQMYASSVRSLDADLTGQALTQVAQGLQLRFNSKGSFDVGTAGNGTRYLYATYDVRNAGVNGVPSTTARSNLTFVAVDANTPETITGTAIRNFKKFDGSNADAALAARVIPTVGMTLNNGTPTVNTSQADFQALTTAEATSIGLPTGVRDVFQYGYVVRNKNGTSRTLPANPAANQYDGLITFAVKLPLQANAANDPYSFSLVFEVVEDSVNRVTRVPEETVSQAQSRATALGASQVDGDTVCRVRVSGAAGSPVTVLTGLGISPIAPGTLDVCFGTNGQVITDVRGTSEITRGLVVQPNGKLVVAANVSAPTGAATGNDFALLRYTADGVLDPTFGTAGKVITELTGDEQLFALDQQADGKLVAAGSKRVSGGPSGTDFVVIRYTADGALDTSFGTNGQAVIAVGAGGSADTPYGLSIQSDGKLILAGFTPLEPGSSDTEVAVVRLTTSGALDTSFGTGGKVVFPVGAAGNLDIANAVRVQLDGKIVVAGYTYDPASNDDIFVARLTGAGVLDTTFDGDGKVITRASTTVSDRANSVAIQSDGKIVVAGGVGDRGLQTRSDAVVVRYTSAGALDTSFASGGIGFYALGAGLDNIYTVRLQGDGKPVLGGSSNNGDPSGTDMVLARLTTSGALDTTFAVQSPLPGVFRVPVSSQTDVAYAFQIQPDGKLVAAGTAQANAEVGVIRVKP
ncbi:hypothetical protein K7W42_15335 [Deinococcus sp. HMF7604]|uniref:delta-60 repeat domain-containing protein n=1 Tax=Deinococcus betulae TaxID=2873312 RepID=UPI001CCA53F1|nr:delta-60 repeat domain-containing protein [Deinococcus betulae]MBZ9752227.1 hypothetical protein [Deinococcus betulae]